LEKNIVISWCGGVIEFCEDFFFKKFACADSAEEVCSEIGREKI
jgi:hypothetical protein